MRVLQATMCCQEARQLSACWRMLSSYDATTEVAETTQMRASTAAMVKTILFMMSLMGVERVGGIDMNLVQVQTRLILFRAHLLICIRTHTKRL